MSVGNGMEDALKLHGYLMKEKSKFSRLHGLTGDINKRYFRIRNIEGSDELALCYYKNSADREVRGWIYLTDVTEIAERQDTIILTSVARTLHLYAQTRAQHSAWVTGLAKLCPDAFTMLGRGVQKAVDSVVDNILPTSSAPTSSIRTKTMVAPLAKDNKQLPKEVSAAGDVENLDEPQVSNAVDEDESSPSTDEKDAQAAFFHTPREHDRRLMRHRGKHVDKSTSRHRQPRESRESWSPSRHDSYHFTDRTHQRSDHHVGPRGDKRGAKDRYHRHFSSHDETRLQRSSRGFVKRGKLDEKGKTRYRTEEQSDLRPEGSEHQSVRKTNTFDEQDNVKETVASPNGTCRSAEDTDDVGDERSSTKCQPQDPQRDIRANDANDKNDRGNTTENRDIDQSEQRDAQPTDDLDIVTSVKMAKVDADRDEGAGTRSEAHDDHSTNQSRDCSSDNENVETIELGEGVGHDDTHTRLRVRQKLAMGQVRQQSDLSTPPDVLKDTNQDEEKEFDEEAEIDHALPPSEKQSWGCAHKDHLATSRLHQHISRSDTEAMDLNGGIPTPKEFLKSIPTRPMSSKQREEAEGGSNSTQSRNLDVAILMDVPKSASKGRRRSAADLEWNDCGETPDRPYCSESKIKSADCTPVDLRDSEDGEEDCLDLDVKKQRRRAAAAVRALEAAAKEADEGPRVENKAHNGYKQSSTDGTRRLVAKACPTPAGPPPPDLVRKARRAHRGIPLGVTPRKAVPPLRVKAANRRTDADANFVGDDWYNETTKSTCYGTPVAGSRDAGDLPAAIVSAPGTLLKSVVGQNRDNHWIHFDD